MGREYLLWVLFSQSLIEKIKCKDRNGGIYELKKRRYY